MKISFPATDRAKKMADALEKESLNDDLPAKQKKNKDSDTLAAIIRKKKSG